MAALNVEVHFRERLQQACVESLNLIVPFVVVIPRLVVEPCRRAEGPHDPR